MTDTSKNVLHRRDTCRLCESAALDLALPMKPSPIADALVSESERGVRQDLYPLDLYLCMQCGHLQMIDIVSPEVLFRNYVYVTSSSLGLVNHFTEYALQIAQYIGKGESNLVVEIGSNDGSLLKAFKEHDYDVIGVDPAREIAARATAEGVTTIPDFFTSALADEIKAQSGEAAVICANNVFAHSDHLADMADGISALLAKEGVFVFEVSYLIDILDKMLFDTIYHEHLSYHAIQPLQTFLERHGLSLVEVIHIPTKGGSIRCIAKRADGSRPQSVHVGELISLEQRRNLFSLTTYREYAQRIEQAKQSLTALLREIKEAGGTIAGYGVSHTVTTLLYQFELGAMLDFVVDDNQSKQGLFSPGDHLPIYSPDKLLELRPNATVVLAWNYADPIIKKNQAYLTQGGKFIIPLPELAIINNRS